MKISVMGYSGSGKSTLAKLLGEHYQLPVFHLDQIHFEKDWKQKNYQDVISELDQILSLKDWIIDGNYGNYKLEQRLNDSDQIVFLSLNRFQCFYRCYKRYLHHRGKTRDDVTPGCLEKFDKTFAWWVLHEGRNSQRKRTMAMNLAPHEKKTIHLATSKDVQNFIAQLPNRKEES